MSDSLTQEHSLHCSVVQVRLVCPATQTVQVWGTSKVCDSCLLARRTQLPFLETKAREQGKRVKITHTELPPRQSYNMDMAHTVLRSSEILAPSIHSLDI